MKQILFLIEERFPEWDVFVEKHPLGLIYHLSSWKRIIEKAFGHIGGHILAIENESGNIIAGIPIYTVKSWLTGNRLVSIPFATICDPLVSSPSDMEILLTALVDFQKEIGAHHIEVRLRHVTVNEKDPRFVLLRHYIHNYLILDSEPEEIMKSFNRNCRRNIIKAVECPLKLKTANTEKDLSAFYTLYLRTRKRLGLPPIPFKFFQAMWREFSPTNRIALLFAVHNGKPVAGLLISKFGNMVIGEALGDQPDYRGFRTSYFLFWNAIRQSYKDGYKIFSFGRTSVKNQGLLSFKRAWGTVGETLSEAMYPRDLFQEKMQTQESSWKYKAAKALANSTPNPFFRIVGILLYRHMG